MSQQKCDQRHARTGYPSSRSDTVNKGLSGTEPCHFKEYNFECFVSKIDLAVALAD